MSNAPTTQDSPGALLDAFVRDGAVTLSHSPESVEYLARSYEHSALPGRPFVRIMPEKLQAAEDLALETLQLAPMGSVNGFYGRRRSIGFPAWAMMNDPGNSHHALALVKDLQRVARKAKSKPGQAKDDATELAAYLGRSAPHFLPTFLEEIGRIYLRVQNAKLAAQFFGKAREAEDTHNLPIDEDRNREVFLEFALGGALSVKTLSEESRKLSRRLPAEEAYEAFRLLSVERVRGGLPPYTGISKDIIALSKAAGRDSAADEHALLAELMHLPAAMEAPAAFWKSIIKRLAKVCRERRDIALVLGATIPNNVDQNLWLDFVRESHIDALLKSGEINAAQWLERFLGHDPAKAPDLPKQLSLIQELAPVIRRQLAERGRQGGADVLAMAPYYLPDPDVLDCLLEHGIPLAKPTSYMHLFLYLRRENNTQELTFLLADQDWSEVFCEGVRYELRRHEKPEDWTFPNAEQRNLLAHPGIRLAMRKIAEDALPVPGDTLAELATKWQTLRLFQLDVLIPIVSDIIGGLDVPDMSHTLAEVLRSGIYDELGWDLLDQVVDTFRTKCQDPKCLGLHLSGITFQESWPYVVVSNQHRAIVLGTHGVVADHVYSIPKKYPMGTWAQIRVQYVDGDLQVIWPTDSYPAVFVGYWASKQQENFEMSSDAYWGLRKAAIPSLEAPQGGRLYGGKPFEAGTRRAPTTNEGSLLSDGKHYWLAKPEISFHNAYDPPTKWVEYDPSTGRLGRNSYPDFMAPAVSHEDRRPVRAMCEMFPASEDFKDSPFGYSGGLKGQRAWVEGNTLHMERIDGVSGAIPVTARFGGSNAAIATLPGGAAMVIMGNALHSLDGAHVQAHTEHDSMVDFRRGTNASVSGIIQHFLKVRDNAGSLRLRETTPAQARLLLESAVAERDAATSKAEQKAVGFLIPKAHGQLVEGVIGIARGAKLLDGLLRGLRDLARQTTSVPSSSATVTEVETEPALKRVALDTDSEQPPAETSPLDTADDMWSAGLVGGWYDHRDANMAVTLDNVETLGHRIDALNEILGAKDSKKRLFRAFTKGSAPALTPEEAVTEVETEISAKGRTGVWPSFLSSPQALIYRAASPMCPPSTRQRILALVEGLLRSGFIGDDRPDRLIRFSWPNVYNKRPKIMAAGSTVTVPLGSAAWETDASSHWVYWAVQIGGTELPPDWKLHPTPTGPVPMSSAALEEAISLLKSGFTFTISQTDVNMLARLTGLPEASCMVLLSGWWDFAVSNSEDPTQRISAADAKTTAALFADVPLGTKRTLLSAAVPLDLSSFRLNGPAVERLAQEYNKHFGGQMAWDQDLAAKAASDLRGVKPMLKGVMEALRSDSRERLDAMGKDHVGPLLWLSYRLPAGHPIRGTLAGSWEGVRESVARSAGMEELAHDVKGALRRTLALPIGGEARVDTVGPFKVEYAPDHWYESRDAVSAAPATLTKEHVGVLQSWLDADQGTSISPGVYVRPAVGQLVTLLSDDVDDLIHRLGDENTTGFLQDPAVGAPEVLEKACAELGLSTDAGRLFLQLLALHDPSTKNVREWNGWTLAAYRKAGAELVDKALVLTAKRPRAGRELFLPGSWIKINDVDLPMEGWKAPMFGIKPVDRPHLPLGVLLPRMHVSALFEGAWARYTSGDQPALVELTTGGKR
ncbi:hypothetical protein [Paenarthrobacter nitroguajacolicus]|uniref:hypothetical protein n=1 Tax=Paenarthrobacter nitroguajacolicus TaxID=211146 RepID=UPI000AC3300C|nr:hypothetical protein [Paenarthrobacter nitroguajacolicus]